MKTFFLESAQKVCEMELCISEALNFRTGKAFFFSDHRQNWLLRIFPKALYIDLLESETYNILLASSDKLERYIPCALRDHWTVRQKQKAPLWNLSFFNNLQTQTTSMRLNTSYTIGIQRQVGKRCFQKSKNRFIYKRGVYDLSDYLSPWRVPVR